MLDMLMSLVKIGFGLLVQKGTDSWIAPVLS
jgi:hypothetical protein